MIIQLPERKRGRRSAQAEADLQASLEAFADGIKRLRANLSFSPSSRGWCYILEEHGLTKGQFRQAQKTINDCRKSGLLPLSITAEDDARQTIGIQMVDHQNPEAYAEYAVEIIRSLAHQFTPFGFWESQEFYVEMLVEKIDLKSLFEPICREFYIPLTNARGWSDLHSRANIMRRFKQHEREGRQCVLLYCGDHDPGGLHIGEFIRSNMAELEGAVGWSPHRLKIDRFGLNADFIEANNLSWIDNLETSSGERLDDPKHRDHGKPYVQNYIKQFGARKVEANALVVRQAAGRQLCRESILQYIDPAAPEIYRAALEQPRSEVIQVLNRIIGG